MQMKPLEIWGHGSWGTQYATTWTTKQTHSKSRAGWDVRSIESKYSPPSPDIQTLTVSLQQHGAVVNCRGLETPAALETWGRRGEDWLLMKVGFWNPTLLHLLSLMFLKKDIHTGSTQDWWIKNWMMTTLFNLLLCVPPQKRPHSFLRFHALCGWYWLLLSLWKQVWVNK